MDICQTLLATPGLTSRGRSSLPRKVHQYTAASKTEDRRSLPRNALGSAQWTSCQAFLRHPPCHAVHEAALYPGNMSTEPCHIRGAVGCGVDSAAAAGVWHAAQQGRCAPAESAVHVRCTAPLSKIAAVTKIHAMNNVTPSAFSTCSTTFWLSISVRASALRL